MPQSLFINHRAPWFPAFLATFVMLYAFISHHTAVAQTDPLTPRTYLYVGFPVTVQSFGILRLNILNLCRNTVKVEPIVLRNEQDPTPTIEGPIEVAPLQIRSHSFQVDPIEHIAVPGLRVHASPGLDIRTNSCVSIAAEILKPNGDVRGVWTQGGVDYTEVEDLN